MFEWNWKRQQHVDRPLSICALPVFSIPFFLQRIENFLMSSLQDKTLSKFSNEISTFMKNSALLRSLFWLKMVELQIIAIVIKTEQYEGYKCSKQFGQIEINHPKKSNFTRELFSVEFLLMYHSISEPEETNFICCIHLSSPHSTPIPPRMNNFFVVQLKKEEGKETEFGGTLFLAFLCLDRYKLHWRNVAASFISVQNELFKGF